MSHCQNSLRAIPSRGNCKNSPLHYPYEPSEAALTCKHMSHGQSRPRSFSEAQYKGHADPVLSLYHPLKEADRAHMSHGQNSLYTT